MTVRVQSVPKKACGFRLKNIPTYTCMVFVVSCGHKTEAKHEMFNGISTKDWRSGGETYDIFCPGLTRACPNSNCLDGERSGYL
jgi:hypothetical protein